MAITYRGFGSWGSGKGAPLTIAEMDENFHYQDQRTQNLIDNPTAPNNINSFTSDGTSLTVVLEDGTEFGPYALPVPTVLPTQGQTVSTATHAPSMVDANNYIRCTNTTECVVTIPTNALVAFPVWTELHYVQAASGAVSIVAASGVTINKRSDRDAMTATVGSVMSLKKCGTNAWDLFGDLAVS